MKIKKYYILIFLQILIFNIVKSQEEVKIKGFQNEKIKYTRNDSLLMDSFEILHRKSIELDNLIIDLYRNDSTYTNVKKDIFYKYYLTNNKNFSYRIGILARGLITEDLLFNKDRSNIDIHKRVFSETISDKYLFIILGYYILDYKLYENCDLFKNNNNILKVYKSMLSFSEAKERLIKLLNDDSISDCAKENILLLLK
jgi:hypothetical protein